MEISKKWKSLFYNIFKFQFCLGIFVKKLVTQQRWGGRGVSEFDIILFFGGRGGGRYVYIGAVEKVQEKQT